MNLMLLKPSSDSGAQVIIHGKVQADMNARDYHQYKTIAMQAVLASCRRQSECYQLVAGFGIKFVGRVGLKSKIESTGCYEAKIGQDKLLELRQA